MGGPAAAETAPVADQIATAPPRFSAGKAASTSASDVGSSAAPPAACSARAATSSPTELAAAHSADATRKRARPPTNTRLRPTRSARRPNGTSSAATTIA